MQLHPEIPVAADYLEGLNDVQLKAVLHTDGPILVVAGPGSGKTKVLTLKIAHLIRSGVNPRKILALTFTNKAAREMKGRIEKVIGHDANLVWAGTFHSIFAKILRVEASRIDFPPNFVIYDTDDAKSVIGKIVKDMGLDTKIYTGGAILGRISTAKSQIITPEAYANNPAFTIQDRQANLPFFADIYRTYMIRLKKAGAMDFDDLLYHLYFVLRDHDEVVMKYRNKFSHFLVDEFQDTNFLQYSIIKKLVKYIGSPNNICAVGDDAQSIYAFRGATIQNILDFEHDFENLTTYKLEQNYRSTGPIVKAANEVIGYNRKQIRKVIWTQKQEGDEIQLIKAMTDSEEGKRVVDMILEQKNRHHLRNSEIAILYRTNSQSRIFEEFLRRYNFAYRVYGGTSFYQRKEIKDLLAYFKTVVNPSNDESLLRIINYPRRGIGDSTIDQIRSYAVEQELSMWSVLTGDALVSKGKKSLTDFTQMMEIFMKREKDLNAFELASMITRQSGLLEILKGENTMESLARVENVNAMLDGIKEFVENDVVEDEVITVDKSLSTWLQSVSLLTDADQSQATEQETITLMSVHSAKGLEFKSVFVTGLEEKLFPSWMSYDVPDGIDEERRLFYVAITRAESYLTLSYANSRYKFGKLNYSDPSRFLDEMTIDRPDIMSRPQLPGQSRSTISGLFKPQRLAVPNNIAVDGANFTPSSSDKILAGSRVLHLKFGEGLVKTVEGATNNRIATIEFPQSGEPEKRIMLKFAKLQVL